MVEEIKKPSKKTLREVLLRSGNICAFPSCNKPIYSRDDVFGCLTHIKGKRPGSPRFDPSQSPEDRHGADNLIVLCDVHGQRIDDNENVSTYSPGVLYRMKYRHETLVEQDIDRNWILPPSSIVDGSLGGTTLHFWIDRHGRDRVYSDEQLAKCSALLQLSIDFSDLSTTLETLKTLEDPQVNALLQQSYAKIGQDSDNLLAHLVELIAEVPEVTFSEFMRFIVDGHDVTELVKLGVQNVQKRIKGERKSFWKINKGS